MQVANGARRRQLLLALAAACFLVGVALRIRSLGHGFQSDEVSLLQRMSSAAIWNDGESAVNPPLLRLLLNTIASGERALELGRWLSLLCGVGALVFVHRIGKRLGGDSVASVMALALATFSSQAIEHSALARPYAPWLLVAAWHVDSVRSWLSNPDARRSDWLPISVSASLLPWIHYVSVPILIVESVVLLALTRRFAFVARCYAPAALAFVPLIPLVTGDGSRRRAGAEVWGESAYHMLGLGSNAGQLVVLALVLLTIVCWRRLDALQRYAGACFAGTLAIVCALGAWIQVRPPMVHMLLPFAGALLAGLPRAFPGRLPAGVSVVLAVTLLVPRAVESVLPKKPSEWDAARTFASNWRDHPLPGAKRVLVIPEHFAPVLYLYLDGGVYPIPGGPPASCVADQGRLCFEHAGLTFVGGAPSAAARGFTHAVKFDRDDRTVPGCRELEQGPASTTFACD